VGDDALEVVRSGSSIRAVREEALNGDRLKGGGFWFTVESRFVEFVLWKL
jgi:hypothetical protein